MKKNWEVKKLGEVCDISTGKWDANHAVENGEFRFFTCAREPMLCNTKRFSGECLVLPGNGVNVGDVYYYKGYFDAYQRTYVISKIKPYPKYLFYHMLAFWKERNLNKQYGSATNFLKIGNFNEYEIPLPPLPEQKRIVAILDKAFTAIVKAKENAEKNLQNSRKLFESYLQNVFANPGDGWGKKKLGEIGETQTGTTPKTSDKENYGNYIPFITPADIDIYGDGRIRYRDEGLSEQGLKNGRKMEKNSILMVCIGASIGKVGYVDRDVSCNQQINSLTVKKGFCPKFFYYALSTKGFFEQVIKNSAQATLPIINKGKWEKLSISCPFAKEEQESIVTKLDALSTEAKNLEAIYRQKLADLEELKKSVLQKAFNGELAEA